MKDYLQPAATFALALAIASLPFTLPLGANAYGDRQRVIVEFDDSITKRHTVYGTRGLRIWNEEN